MRFARAFSMVRTVMRRATPPAALGLIATNRYRPVQPCPRQGAPPPARLACAGSRTHTRPARPRAPWAIFCPGALFHNFCAQIRAGLTPKAIYQINERREVPISIEVAVNAVPNGNFHLQRDSELNSPRSRDETSRASPAVIQA